jgi:gliding motility-associated-like protein
VPNIFSPNSDGGHDFWVIANGGEGMSLEIFNRWGNLVYESENYDNTWDGKRNGEDLPGGVYFYIIKFTDGRKPVQGYVTIIR